MTLSGLRAAATTISKPGAHGSRTGGQSRPCYEEKKPRVFCVSLPPAAIVEQIRLILALQSQLVRSRVPLAASSCHSEDTPRAASFGGMAPKKMTVAPLSSGAQWIETAAQRFDHYAAEVGALESLELGGSSASASARPAGLSRPPPGRDEGRAKSATRAGQGYRSKSLGAHAKAPSFGIVPPRAWPQTPKEEFSVLRITEKTALGFAPSRRAVMILGRPVVAPSITQVGVYTRVISLDSSLHEMCDTDMHMVSDSRTGECQAQKLKDLPFQ